MGSIFGVTLFLTTHLNTHSEEPVQHEPFDSQSSRQRESDLTSLSNEELVNATGGPRSLQTNLAILAGASVPTCFLGVVWPVETSMVLPYQKSTGFGRSHDTVAFWMG